MDRPGRKALALALGTVLAAVVPASAQAAFPGANGPIVWSANTGDQGGGTMEIWVMDADGTGKDQVTDNALSDDRPAISPDGQKIVFQSSRTALGEPSNNTELIRVDVDGTGEEALTDDSVNDFDPTFSPDGTRIVWSRGADIWVMDSDGTDPANLTNTPLAFEAAPEFSPDGTKIAFTSNGRASGNPGDPYDPNNVWVMNANGSNRVKLTEAAPAPTPDGNFDPSWSPDGARIAYVASFGSADNEIYVMDADGTDEVALTSTAVNETQPVFSPDGTLVAFTSPGGDSEIVTSSSSPPASGGPFTFLTSNAVTDEYAYWGPDAGGGAAPNTKITRRPDDRTTARRVRYSFRAIPPEGASFECKFDSGRFKACSSPKRYRNLSPGRHRFAVRASNASGTDPTPARDSFKVKR